MLLGDVLGLDPGVLLTEVPSESPRVLLRAEVERLELDDLADAVDAVVARAEGMPSPKRELRVSVDDPARAAQELIALARATQPPVDVNTIARRCGVRLVGEMFAWDTPISGFLVELESGPIIGINESHSEGRQRFTVAHELGHYLLRHHDHYHLDMGSAMAHGEDPNYNWRDERNANEFAAEFLMPAAMVMLAARKHDTVQALAHLFLVSKEAMGFRMINLGLRYARLGQHPVAARVAWAQGPLRRWLGCSCSDASILTRASSLATKGSAVLSVVVGIPCTHRCTHAARNCGISDSADPLG